MLQVRFCSPAEELRPYLGSYSFTEIEDGAPLRARLVPSWATIRFVLEGRWVARLTGEMESRESWLAALFGPTGRAVEFTGFPPARTIGVSLLPLGWARLIGKPASDFADRIVPLGEVFPNDAGRLVEALGEAEDDKAAFAILDAFFLKQGVNAPAASAKISRAHALLLDPQIVTVEQFAAGLGLSPRHAGRLSTRFFGFSPKFLLRRQRFLRTLGRVSMDRSKLWTSLLDDSYFDQPQFAREFRQFMGVSPREYAAEQRELLEAVARQRQETLGAPLQGLHPTTPSE